MATLARYPTTITTRNDVQAVCEYRTFDVWGNARDGYEANDTFSHGEISVRATVAIHNMPLLPNDGDTGFNLDGTDKRVFVSFYLDDKDIKKALGIKCRIGVGGDDHEYHIERKRDGFPIASLSIIRFEAI